MEIGQNLRQAQNLKFSQQMIQSINLLAENSTQLCERIYSEVEKNPALEIVRDVQNVNSSTVKKTQRLETSYETENYGSQEKSDVFQSFLESSPDNSETLQDHLLKQLNELPLSEQENEIGRLIIQNLDDKGYFVLALENLFEEKAVYEKALSVLQKIHQFDPVGVACKNLGESLYLQAVDKNLSDFTKDFLKNHFELLALVRVNSIQKKLKECGVEATSEQIEKCLDEIRLLDPYPARQYSSEQTVFISPDVKVIRNLNTEDEKAEFSVELVKTNLPSVKLNSELTEFEQSNEQIKKAIQEAQAFLNALEVRNQTLLKTAIYVVNYQHDFFEKGAKYLKPLRMKDVAAELGVHETTISRIANEKYLSCEWGLYEFKFFFTNAVNVSCKSAGTKTSASTNPAISVNTEKVLSKESIKQELLKIIQENEKAGGKQLSDQKLSDELSKRGINIARRTVAKYRQELNFDSSYNR